VSPRTKKVYELTQKYIREKQAV